MSVGASGSRPASPTTSVAPPPAEDFDFGRAASIEALSNSSEELLTNIPLESDDDGDEVDALIVTTTVNPDNPEHVEVVIVDENAPDGEGGNAEGLNGKGKTEETGDEKDDKKKDNKKKTGKKAKKKTKHTTSCCDVLCCCKPKKVTPAKKGKVSVDTSCCSFANANKWRKRFFKFLSGPGMGFIAGIGGMWLFMRSGGSGASAIAGMVGVSVSANAKGSVEGDNNVIVGQGQVGLININNAAVGGTGVTEEDLRHLIQECMRTGMFYKNPASGALYTFSPMDNKAVCLRSIPDSMQKGECSLDPAVAKQYEHFGKFGANPAPGRHRRSLDNLPSTSAMPSLSPDEINDDFPLQAADYELFNTLIVVGGVTLGIVIHRLFITPVLNAMAAYKRGRRNPRGDMS